MSSGFDGDLARRAAEIRAAGKAWTVFAATAKGDLTALGREVTTREQSIKRKARRLLGNPKVKEDPRPNGDEGSAYASPERGGPSSAGSGTQAAELIGRLTTPPLSASVGPRPASRWRTTARAVLHRHRGYEPENEAAARTDSQAMKVLAKTIAAS